MEDKEMTPFALLDKYLMENNKEKYIEVWDTLSLEEQSDYVIGFVPHFGEGLDGPFVLNEEELADPWGTIQKAMAFD